MLKSIPRKTWSVRAPTWKSRVRPRASTIEVAVTVVSLILLILLLIAIGSSGVLTRRLDGRPQFDVVAGDVHIRASIEGEPLDGLSRQLQAGNAIDQNGLVVGVQREADHRAAAISKRFLPLVRVQARGPYLDVIAGDAHIGAPAQFHAFHGFRWQLQDADAINKDRLLVSLAREADHRAVQMVRVDCESLVTADRLGACASIAHGQRAVDNGGNRGVVRDDD